MSVARLTVYLIHPASRYPWSASHPGKFRSYLVILHCLSALSQDTLPFHACAAVQSNDVLFVGDDEYVRPNQQQQQQQQQQQHFTLSPSNFAYLSPPAAITTLCHFCVGM